MSKSTPKSLQSPDIAKLVLDVMQQNFTGRNFDEAKWLTFSTCMVESSLDFPILRVTNQIWEGFLQYGRSNGTVGDPWVI